MPDATSLTPPTDTESAHRTGRSLVEYLPEGTEHRTGVWLADQRQRRDRLDVEQLRALAELGVEWAGSAV
ncbi:hypothetical protein ACIBEA_41625 [Streptomyces sp. NPDC051555]|uniref:hypothetical protein n=1 Tax=Streptomyces sp. NPDC051555 TaxID=3365657 RepID=UPI0037925C72